MGDGSAEAADQAAGGAFESTVSKLERLIVDRSFRLKLFADVDDTSIQGQVLRACDSDALQAERLREYLGFSNHSMMQSVSWHTTWSVRPHKNPPPSGVHVWLQALS